MFSTKLLAKDYLKQYMNCYRLISNSKSIETISNEVTNASFQTSDHLHFKQSLNFDCFKSLVVNKRIEAKVKVIMCEYELYRTTEPMTVPSTLTIDDMKQLVKVWKMKKSKRHWIDLSFKTRKHLMFLMRKLEQFDGSNQLAIPIMPLQKEKFYSNRLRNAALFGQNIIFDLSFDKYMSTLECKNCAEQLWRIYHYNRYNTSPKELPFNLNLVNLNCNERTYHFINQLFPEFYSNDSYLNITSKSYLDLFPKEKLVYLSPHAEEVMTDFDPNVCFIIGGIVDRQKVINLSYEKAKQENIRSMRLPLDNMFRKHNIQSLDDVIRVLDELKSFSGLKENINFNKIFRRHLPNYKLKSEGQIAYELMQNQGLDFDDLEDYDSDSDENCDDNINMNCK